MNPFQHPNFYMLMNVYLPATLITLVFLCPILTIVGCVLKALGVF